jgi:hypothetical protein
VTLRAETPALQCAAPAQEQHAQRVQDRLQLASKPNLDNPNGANVKAINLLNRNTCGTRKAAQSKFQQL